MATKVKDVMKKRPYDKEQTAFEKAWNTKNWSGAQKIVKGIPDATMRDPLQHLLNARRMRNA